MSYKIRVCFEVSVADEEGLNAFGMQVSMGETDTAVDYEQLTKAVDIDKLISVACLDTMGVTKDAVRIITPEEYDRLYGEEDNDERQAD